MHSTLSEAFLATAAQFAEKTAIISPTGTYTFGQCAAAALSVAQALEDRGEAEHVGILLPTSEAFALLYFGTLLSGRVPVPLNFFLSPQELSAILADAGVRTAFTVKAFEQTAAGLNAETVFVEDWLGEALRHPRATPRAGGTTATVLYTSGTTGTPKGVVLTHANLLANVAGCVDHISFSPEHRLLGLLPLFHTFALTTTLLLPTLVGATTVFMPRFDARAAAEAVAAHSITTLMAVPSMYRAMLRTLDQAPADLSSLTLPISGGEALGEDLFDVYRERHGVALLEGYGMTETSPVVSANIPDALKGGTVGRPLPNVEVRVVDDSGQDAGVNVDGEIWVRGPSVMEGYFKRPEETASVMTGNAFLKTGDIGRVDEDGFLSITGRKKEMIISAGENIFPREIELVLALHPSVAEAAVIGIPHKMRGEAPKAFIVLKEGCSCCEDDLKEHCRSHIAKYKVPVEIEFRSEFPHSPMGKVLKQILVKSQRAPGEKR